MLTWYSWKGRCLMQCIEDIVEVVCRVIHTGNFTTAWVVVVIMASPGIVPNINTIIPLKEPTLIDKDCIAILVGTHYQDGLEGVHLRELQTECFAQELQLATYIVCDWKISSNLIPQNNQHPITFKVSTSLCRNVGTYCLHCTTAWLVYFI